MKIAFFSCNCLMDPASGAARSVRTILEMLAARGHEARAITGAMFDAPDKDTESLMLAGLGFAPGAGGVSVLERDGVRHEAVSTGVLQVGKAKDAEFQHLAEAAMARLAAFAPDVVVSYGATKAEHIIRAQLSRRGVASVFYLANPSYKGVQPFADCDLVMTDSLATQAHYAEKLGLETVPIGKFIHPIRRIEGETPRYVTFINPSFHKGVTLFYRIAEMMRHQVPDAVFQVVESRATLRQIEVQTRLPFGRLPNIRAIGAQADMARIYARTKVLLVPSLWHESGPRVGLEAMSLGIPVIGANHSGLRENIGAGGILLEVPEKMRAETRLIPPPRVALPWVAALEQLLTDPEAYAEASAAATAHWQAHLSEDRIGKVEALLRGLVEAV